MLEALKKALLSGFGAVILTKEKAEEITRKLVKESKLSKEDAQKLMDELFETGSREWSDIEESLSKSIRKGVENLDIPSKKELHGLKSKVGKPEKRIETLEQELSKKEGK